MVVIPSAHRGCGAEVPGWEQLADCSGSLVGDEVSCHRTMSFGWNLPRWTVGQACESPPHTRISLWPQLRALGREGEAGVGMGPSVAQPAQRPLGITGRMGSRGGGRE